jgi:hypothetical protein
MNAIDVIFGLACPCRPHPKEGFEEDPDEELGGTFVGSPEVYRLLLDAQRERTLIGLGLDPRDYLFENDRIILGAICDFKDLELNPPANRYCFPSAG